MKRVTLSQTQKEMLAKRVHTCLNSTIASLEAEWVVVNPCRWGLVEIIDKVTNTINKALIRLSDEEVQELNK